MKPTTVTAVEFDINMAECRNDGEVDQEQSTSKKSTKMISHLLRYSAFTSAFFPEAASRDS